MVTLFLLSSFFEDDVKPTKEKTQPATLPSWAANIKRVMFCRARQT